MTDPTEASSPLTVLPAESQRKGHPVIAWCAILAVTAVIVVLQTVRPPRGGAEGREQVTFVTLQLQARYLVGAADLFGSGPSFYAQAQVFNTGPVEQRLRFVVLAGELAGAKEALKQLQDLESRLDSDAVKPTDQQLALLDMLLRLYSDYERRRFEAPSLNAKDRDRLREDLGWYGELALAPAGTPDQAARAQVLAPAHRTVYVFVTVFSVLGLVGLVGLGGLVVFLSFLFLGRLRTGIRCGAPHHAVYAETFAIWMILFVGLSIGISILNARFPLPGWENVLSGFGSLLSLAALAWPVLRGVPWRQVRWEVGLRAGRQPALEPFLGLVNYAMALPLVALGFALTLLLMYLQRTLQGGGNPFDPTNAPSHPIVKDIAGGGWWVRLQVLLLACVLAPVVEEIMFRGVLYRHLREATDRFRFLGSFLLSATVTSFIFAVIHPQGLLLVPTLMGVAYGLTLVREWRGTLIPGMVTHGVHNGVVLLIGMLTLGD